MALLSKVKICNLALGHIGNKTTIESLTEDSVEASTCNLFYDEARLFVLEQFDWNITRKRVTLALDADDAPDGVWSFRYVYPVDCVRARKMQNPLFVNTDLYTGITDAFRPDPIPFTIELSDDGERRTILTNLEDAILVYTTNLTDPLLFSTMFSMALSFVLASYIAYKLTGKMQLKDVMFQQARLVFEQAASQDANEEMEAPPRDVDWIRVRA